jgi:hypothetical protein
MKALSFGWAVVPAVMLWCAADGRASDTTESELRRRIRQLSHELRDERRGENGDGRTGRGRDRRARDPSGFMGIGVPGLFNSRLDIASQAWENARRGQYGLVMAGGRPGGGAVDLNGRPIRSIVPSQAQPGPQGVAGAGEADEAEPKDRAEAEKEATSKALEAAQLLVDNGECGAARRMLLPIAASRRRSQEEVDAAKKLIEEIDTRGMKRVLEADEAAAGGDTDRAALVYDEVARKYGGAPAAALARTKLAVLKADPQVAARFLFEKAQRYARSRRSDVAVPLLREVVKRYAQTRYAADAAAMLQKLEEQAAQEGMLSEEEALAARKWLIIGDIHALNGRGQEATRSYDRVIQDYKDSKYAQTAREKIAGLAAAE